MVVEVDDDELVVVVVLDVVALEVVVVVVVVVDFTTLKFAVSVIILYMTKEGVGLELPEKQPVPVQVQS